MQKFSREISSYHAWQWVGFAVIAFLTLMVYWPALFHTPRADQILYLAEVMDKQDFWSLTGGSHDLNRNRQFAPGDEILFRPFVYFILGSERYFFQNNFFLWQMTGILMHLAVLWQLLALLLTLRTGFSAVVATMFFAVLLSNMEMVIWHHITSYLIFLFCFVKILRLLLKDEFGNIDWLTLWICSTFMCFIYELGNVYTLMIFAWLWQKFPKDQRKWGLLFPVVVYTTLSSWNFLALHSGPALEKNLVDNAFVFKTGLNFLLAAMWWLWMGLFPSQIPLILGGRNIIDPHITFPIPPVAFSKPLVYAGFLLAVSLSAMIWKNRAESLQKRSLWLQNTAAMLGVFVLLYVLGRANVRGFQETFFNNLYYAYFFWLMLTILMYALIGNVRTKKRWAMMALIAVLILAGYNSIRLYKLNDFQSRATNPTLVLIRTLDLLISEHRKEPGFSFYVAPYYPGNINYVDVKKVSDPTGRVYSLAEVLYPKYFSEQYPKYNFVTSPGEPVPWTKIMGDR